MEEEIKGSDKMDQRGMMIKELAQGIELVKELRARISVSSNGNGGYEDNQALNQSLVEKMLSVFDKSISLAKLFECNNEHVLPHGSPPSQGSTLNLRVSKKRKMSPRIKWVRVNPGGSASVLGGPLDDGFSWRKYGQKEILKAKYPRGYYRCTHRHTRGCLATKQVQKSDHDPSVYQIIYKGDHTCAPMAHMGQTDKKLKLDQIEPEPQLPPIPQQQCPIVESNQQEVNLGFSPEEAPKIEPIKNDDEAQIFESLLSSARCQHELGRVDDNIANSSSGLWSSEQNYFSTLSTFDPGFNVRTSEYDLNGLMLGPGLGPNSTNVGDFMFPLDMLDIDANFSSDFDPLACLIYAS